MHDSSNSEGKLGPKSPIQLERDARAARVAAALRANLMKRKAQARARSTDSAQDAPSMPPEGTSEA